MKKQVFVLVSSSDLVFSPAHGLEHQEGEQEEKKKKEVFSFHFSMK